MDPTKRFEKPKHARLPLTARQWEVLDMIRTHLRKFKVVPSLREIGETLGINSVNGVRTHLNALERKGAILRRKYSSRSIIVLADEKKEGASIQVVGQIANRKLVQNIEDDEPHEICNRMIQCAKDCFAVMFLDNSLAREYLIQKDDYLILRPTRSACEDVTLLIVDGSMEVYLVRCQRNRKKGLWEYYSCGTRKERVNISNPVIFGQVVTLFRFAL